MVQTPTHTSSNWAKRLLGWRQLLVVVLTGLVLASALAVITSAHLTRVQYARLQQLESEKDRLQTEWGQLLLEESTWSAPSRIERLASERLDMRVPELDEIRVIRR
ncbi:cell division protein FtsL [Modicisalibacter ilicicola DSM 19980]|uniref:Cell division protein FtsL n=1 Tax=Modicisalibacter ilicicola DSM 19980 TaxID=1121942 RepID=A0A1M5C650_9GAMM|nr:cell division protein FtsL [Halomonas ilicicola]SHF50219.1 cell division protein FtsL [Halomonas ilicicola DSM 19980]